METRTLAHTGLTVSRACLGTMTFGSDTNESMAARIVDSCLDRGVNFFDTANVYNFGQSETILGNLLKGRRDRAVVASKVRMKMGDGPTEGGLSAPAVLKNAEDTLRRLQTDYLDIYYLHSPDYGVPIQETLEAMDKLVQAGKVRHPAVSNYAAWQISQIHCLSGTYKYKSPRISQTLYNPLARAAEQEFVPFCREFGVSLVAYNPLARGLLTGTRKTAPPVPAATDRAAVDRYQHPAYFAAVDELRAAAEQAGRSLIDLSINWLLHHTATDCIVLGAINEEQLAENLAAFESGRLSPESLAACETAWDKLRGVTPRYSR